MNVTEYSGREGVEVQSSQAVSTRVYAVQRGLGSALAGLWSPTQRPQQLLMCECTEWELNSRWRHGLHSLLVVLLLSNLHKPNMCQVRWASACKMIVWRKTESDCGSFNQLQAVCKIRTSSISDLLMGFLTDWGACVLQNGSKNNEH